MKPVLSLQPIKKHWHKISEKACLKLGNRHLLDIVNRSNRKSKIYLLKPVYITEVEEIVMEIMQLNDNNNQK